MTNGYNAYKTNTAMTASPQELTLMLYNGALKFCALAIEALQKNDISAAHKNNLKVQAIINELRITLDMKYAIAKEMDALYIYIVQLLVDSNIEKNVTKLEEAKKLITEFRDTWKQILNK